MSSHEGWRLSWDVAFALLYVLAIFVIGSLPGGPSVAPQVSDKLLHAIGFALLAWLWCRALARLRPDSHLAHSVGGGFLVSIGVGGALELWQGWLAYRTCELLDWVADAAGAALAVALYAGVEQVLRARRSAAE